MEYVPVASYSLEILSPEVKLHKIHGSVSKVWRCGHVSSFLQCPCHSAPDIKYTNGGQVPSPLPCVLAEKSYQDSSGYACKEPTFNCVKQKKKKKKVYLLAHVTGKSKGELCFSHGWNTEPHGWNTHPLSLPISQFLFFLNQLHSEAPFHVFHMLRKVSIGGSKPAFLGFWSIRREDLSLPGPIYGSLLKGLWLVVLGGHWLSLHVQPRVLLK